MVEKPSTAGEGQGDLAVVRAELGRLERLIADLPAGVYSTTPDGRLLRANRRAADLLGYASEDDLLGRSVFDLYADPADRAETLALLDRDGAITGHEIRMRRKDGSELWAALSAKAVVEDGEVAYFDGIAIDVTARHQAETERRRLEAQMLESQKLESLGLLAGGIAHDFNNLLVGVLGYADLALTAATPGSPMRTYLEGVEAAARRAADLANQLLVYAGRVEPKAEPVDLSALVGELAPLIGISVRPREALTYQLAPDLPSVSADASQLRQVVMNLVWNACESLSEERGTITIRTLRASQGEGRPLVPGAQEPGQDYACLEVADTGCGMDEEVRQRVFEPFYSTKLPGRGLGMAAVYGIVRQHQGTIAIDSKPGWGTTVRVLLPCGAAPAPVRRRRASSSEWRGSGKALLADDDESVRGAGAELLQLLGFEVVTAADGEEAVASFARHADEIRLVVLDLTMPRTGGAEVLDQILALRPGARVVLSSGQDYRAAGTAPPGAAGFLEKPYTLADLRAVAEAALS